MSARDGAGRAPGPGPGGRAAVAPADYIAAMPKAELHVHLEGAIAPETLLALAEGNRIALPVNTVEQIRALYRYRDFDTFKRVLLLGVRCLRRPEDFDLVVRRLGAALAAQNVRYAEVFWTPQFYRNLGHPTDALLAAMNAGREAVRQAHGVMLRWIPDIVRSVPAAGPWVVDWATSDAARAGGVVALGLAGPEAGHPAAPFAALFRLARERGLPANPHAGEGTGAASVRATLDVLRPARIGHGVDAAWDPALLHRLAEEGVALEVCPTSNVRLGLFPDYAAHPLRRLVEAGCLVTVNTDDPALFATTLSREYRHAVEDCGLSLDALDAIALNALRASYLPAAEKAALLSAFQAEQARLKATPGSAPS